MSLILSPTLGENLAFPDVYRTFRVLIPELSVAKSVWNPLKIGQIARKVGILLSVNAFSGKLDDSLFRSKEKNLF